MVNIEREIERYLTLLSNKIRDKGLTQLEVQAQLGWGRSYISQLMTRQKSLRVDQVLSILDVICVEPAVFFEELYGTRAHKWRPRKSKTKLPGHEIERLRLLVLGLLDLLEKKGLVTKGTLEEVR